jgi:hypothetical protein
MNTTEQAVRWAVARFTNETPEEAFVKELRIRTLTDYAVANNCSVWHAIAQVDGEPCSCTPCRKVQR